MEEPTAQFKAIKAVIKIKVSRNQIRSFAILRTYIEPTQI